MQPVQSLRRYASLYVAFLGQHFKVLMEYRLNFIIGAVSTVSLQMASILTIWVIMSQIPSLNGWTLNEILLIYGLLTLSKSLNHMFADNLWTIGNQYIRSGNFDRFLLRPIDPLFHLLADRFCQDGVGNFLVGLFLVIGSTSAQGIVWTLPNLLYIIVAVISGGLIFFALNLATAVSAFWIVNSVPTTRAVYETHWFAQFPLTIYPRAVGILMTWLIPYGFASFYPASQLLGRDIGALAWIGPFVAVVAVLLAYRLWRFGLRHYVGTGS